MVVRGKRILLRYPEPGDAAALFALARDPEVTRYFSWGPYERRQQAADYIASLPQRRAAGDLLDFLVVDAERGPAGITGLSSLSRRDRRAVVGTWLGRAHWGSGANAASKRLVLALAFERLGLQRVGAYAATGNARSQRALERIGFRREGVLRGFHRHGERTHDVVSFSLLRSEWAPAGEDIRFEGAPPDPWVVTSAAIPS